MSAIDCLLEDPRAALDDARLLPFAIIDRS